MKTASLRTRLLWRIALLMTVGLGTIGTFAYLNTREEAREIYDAQLAHFAKVLASMSEDEIEEGTITPRVISTDNSHFITPYEKDFAYRVWWKNTAILQSDNALLFGASSQSLGYTDRMTSRGLWRFFVLQEGDLIVEVGEDYEARHDLIEKIALSILGPLLFVFPLLMAAIWCGVRFGIAPLDRLQQQLSTQQPESLKPIAIGAVPQEINALVYTLNSLILKVEGVIDREKRFASYAAHELRTPLAALRTQVQVALRSPDVDEQKALFSEVVEGIDRMGHLVQQLLILVRAQNLTLPDTTVCISTLADRVCKEMTPFAAEKQQKLNTEITPSLYIRGDEAMLAALLRNLIDNAIRYSPERTHITVTLTSTAIGTMLTVENEGAELSKEQCECIFEPFYRGQQNTTQGTGLGLSIVAWIAKQHQAKITCVSESPKTTITVKF